MLLTLILCDLAPLSDLDIDLQHVCDLMHPCDADMQSQVSVNCACWMPEVGQGITYATNKGDLHICTPGSVMAQVLSRTIFCFEAFSC